MQNFFENLGLIVDNLITDGTCQRVKTTTSKGRALPGWYYAKEYKAHLYITAGNWQTGEKARYTDNGVETTPEVSAVWKQLAKQAESERLRKHQETAERTARLLPRLKSCETHPYLDTKKIPAYGEIYLYNNNILIPIYNRGDLCGYQTIDSNGKKLFYAGTNMSGSYFIIGGGTATTYLCEGYATACTIHQATQQQVICAFNAGNLPKVAKHFSGKTLIVCADNDESGTGKKYADQCGIPIVMPPVQGDFNDYGLIRTKAMLNPKVEVYIPETVAADNVLFPTKDIYKGAPDIYKRIYDEWMESITEPIGGFAFATIESAMQVLCGNKVLTPTHGRTVATYSLCGSHSGAGKDLNSKNPLRRLREQLLSSASNLSNSYYTSLTTGVGNITNDTAFINHASNLDGTFLWITTEASEPLRQLSTHAGAANQGSSLAVAMNDSYDGHEINGKVKANETISGINYPLIPVCWLTQLSELKQQLTQKLLELGTLGRFDYILDYNPLRAEKGSFEGAPVIGQETSHGDVETFSTKTVETIINAITNRPKGVIKFADVKARKMINDFDIELKERYDSTKGLGKFVCRTSMSIEKRLCAWVAMDNRNAITVADIKAIMPWFKYQIAMREQVYNREIRKDSDLLVAIKDCIKRIVQKKYGPVTRKSSKKNEYTKQISRGFVPKSDMQTVFNRVYGEDQNFKPYTKRTAMERELELLRKDGEIIIEMVPTFHGPFLAIVNV